MLATVPSILLGTVQHVAATMEDRLYNLMMSTTGPNGHLRPNFTIEELKFFARNSRTLLKHDILKRPNAHHGYAGLVRAMRRIVSDFHSRGEWLTLRSSSPTRYEEGNTHYEEGSSATSNSLMAHNTNSEQTSERAASAASLSSPSPSSSSPTGTSAAVFSHKKYNKQIIQAVPPVYYALLTLKTLISGVHCTGLVSSAEEVSMILDLCRRAGGFVQEKQAPYNVDMKVTESFVAALWCYLAELVPVDLGMVLKYFRKEALPCAMLSITLWWWFCEALQPILHYLLSGLAETPIAPQICARMLLGCATSQLDPETVELRIPSPFMVLENPEQRWHSLQIDGLSVFRRVVAALFSTSASSSSSSASSTSKLMKSARQSSNNNTFSRWLCQPKLQQEAIRLIRKDAAQQLKSPDHTFQLTPFHLILFSAIGLTRTVENIVSANVNVPSSTQSPPSNDTYRKLKLRLPLRKSSKEDGNGGEIEIDALLSPYKTSKKDSDTDDQKKKHGESNNDGNDGLWYSIYIWALASASNPAAGLVGINSADDSMTAAMAKTASNVSAAGAGTSTAASSALFQALTVEQLSMLVRSYFAYALCGRAIGELAQRSRDDDFSVAALQRVIPFLRLNLLRSNRVVMAAAEAFPREIGSLVDFELHTLSVNLAEVFQHLTHLTLMSDPRRMNSATALSSVPGPTRKFAQRIFFCWLQIYDILLRIQQQHALEGTHNTATQTQTVGAAPFVSSVESLASMYSLYCLFGSMDGPSPGKHIQLVSKVVSQVAGRSIDSGASGCSCRSPRAVLNYMSAAADVFDEILREVKRTRSVERRDRLSWTTHRILTYALGLSFNKTISESVSEALLNGLWAPTTARLMTHPLSNPACAIACHNVFISPFLVTASQLRPFVARLLPLYVNICCEVKKAHLGPDAISSSVLVKSFQQCIGHVARAVESIENIPAPPQIITSSSSSSSNSVKANDAVATAELGSKKHQESGSAQVQGSATGGGHHLQKPQQYSGAVLVCIVAKQCFKTAKLLFAKPSTSKALLEMRRAYVLALFSLLHCSDSRVLKQVCELVTELLLRVMKPSSRQVFFQSAVSAVRTTPCHGARQQLTEWLLHLEETIQNLDEKAARDAAKSESEGQVFIIKSKL